MPDSDLTIFVSTFNRLGTLANCLACLRRQDHPHRVVIVDNGSTHPEAVEYLELLSEDYTVYWMPRIEDVPAQEGDEDAHGGNSMQAVQRNVQECFRREWYAEPRPRWYAMTDADVWLDGPHNSLDIYMALAEEIGYAVGPHLRLSVHDNYPLRACALIQHARIMFRDRMEWFGEIPFSRDPIDTTFHLFPASPTFNRLGMETVRVGPPWTATHSDWLIDICNPTVENHAYILGCGEAASWGGRWLRPVFEKWLESPEAAFEYLLTEKPTYEDYFHPWFMLAWMYQYGHGCEVDLKKSRSYMRKAIPRWAPVWEFAEDWDALVYRNDQSFLGW